MKTDHMTKIPLPLLLILMYYLEIILMLIEVTRTVPCNMTTNWSQKVQKSILKKPGELTKIPSDGILNAFGLYNARI